MNLWQVLATLDPALLALVIALLLALLWPRGKGQSHYGSADYWERRYSMTQGQTYEWYVDLQQIARTAVLPKSSLAVDGLRVLDVGCGNSQLAEQLRASAGGNASLRVTAIDFVENALEAMRDGDVLVGARTAGASSAVPPVRYMWMDARVMSFGDGAFDLAVDKGTLDGIVGDASARGIHDALSVVAEVARVLRPHGTYLTVSVTDWSAGDWTARLGIDAHFEHLRGARLLARGPGGKPITVFCHAWVKSKLPARQAGTTAQPHEWAKVAKGE